MATNKEATETADILPNAIPKSSPTDDALTDASNPATIVPQAMADVEIPPTKPPRPLSPQQQAEKTLVEAFPSIDGAVIKAVLTASGGSVEPAFDALLGMSDPSSQREPPPPAKPPRRPVAEDKSQTPTARSQMEADEQYARQLHEHYASREPRQQPRQQVNRQPQPPTHSVGEQDKQYSFIDDDLPMIRENIRQGFMETQSTVNKWLTNFKKKIDGEDDDDLKNQQPRPSQGFPPRDQSYANYGRRSGEMARRSADRERYDADPHVLGDDFSNLELRDDEAPPKKPQRPLANPDLLRSGSPGSGRKVAFQAGPAEEIPDARPGSTKPLKTQIAAGKASKWQPLSAVEPSPITDNDPFSLGDSDDDKDSKVKESKSDETERLQAATQEPVLSPLGDSSKSEAATKPETGKT